VFPVDGEPQTVPVESADPWGPEIEEFVSCVEGRRQPAQGTGEQASLALRTSLAAVRSLESGRPEAV
jgi:predicted dehydrogenase